VRQIRMLRAMRRELETGLRPLLPGHEGGNPGHRQGAAYGLPRQFPTLPGWTSTRASLHRGHNRRKHSQSRRSDGRKRRSERARTPS
jgi:hypothetical protein